MSLRPLSCLAVALSLAGCAGERLPAPMGLGYHGGDVNKPAATSGRPHVSPRETRVVPRIAAPLPGAPMKQTLGGKVLSAIAFERVTGMTADPRRFKDLK